MANITDFEFISSLAQARTRGGSKWIFTNSFDESLEGFAFPESVQIVWFIDYQHSLDNVVFSQNVKILKLIRYNLPLNGNFQNIQRLILDDCQTIVPANINDITIINGLSNNQIIADAVQRYSFIDCQVLNTTFENTKLIKFENCAVENVSFSSELEFLYTDTDILKQLHFSIPCKLYIQCQFEIIEFDHDMIIMTHQIIDHPRYKLMESCDGKYVYEYRQFKLVFVD
jgi:hypothetical protein